MELQDFSLTNISVACECFFEKKIKNPKSTSQKQ